MVSLFFCDLALVDTAETVLHTGISIFSKEERISKGKFPSSLGVASLGLFFNLLNNFHFNTPSRLLWLEFLRLYTVAKTVEKLRGLLG